MFVFLCKQACTGVFEYADGMMLQVALQPQTILGIFFTPFSIFHNFNPLKTSSLCAPPPPLSVFLSLLYSKALGINKGTAEPYLSGLKASIFLGRMPSPSAAFAPGLRMSPHEGTAPSLTVSSSQAKALLASLSASGLCTEALLLSSALRQRRLLREQKGSSSLPNSLSSTPTSSSSPTTPTPSLSPSSPTPLGNFTFSSMVVKPTRGRSDSPQLLSSRKDGDNS